MSIDTEKLIAYLDGELVDADRAEVEAALAADPALREKLERHRRVRTQLQTAFDPTVDEPIPARLRELLEPPQKNAPASAPAEIVRLDQRRAASRWSVREWGAMAASVVLGLFVGVGVMSAQAPLIAATEHGLTARGALSRALDTQLASDDAGAVRIGVSFRRADGGYCRTFDLTERATSGLACREGDGWAVAMTAASPAGGEMRMAGTSPEIMSAVDAMIAGEPLDASAEAAARDSDWR